MDIYIDVQTVNITNFLALQMHGRYCGYSVKDVPKVLVSHHRIILIVLYTDQRSEKDAQYQRRTSYKGFKGTYEFISDRIYNVSLHRDMSLS